MAVGQFKWWWFKAAQPHHGCGTQGIMAEAEAEPRPHATSWHSVYDAVAMEWGEERTSSEAEALPVPAGCPLWKCYMMELVTGRVTGRRGPGVLLSTEGAKICAPILAVVPGARGVLAMMAHFGSYESHFKRDEEDKSDGRAPLLRRVEAPFARHLSLANAYTHLVSPMLARAAAAARAAGVKATVIVALGSERDYTVFLEQFLRAELEEVKQYGAWIRLEFHRSYRQSDAAAGDNCLFHAHVSAEGRVTLQATRTRFYVDDAAGRTTYRALSRNSFELADGFRTDGSCMPGFYEVNNALMFLPPGLQRFLLIDMDAPRSADEARRVFSAALLKAAAGLHTDATEASAMRAAGERLEGPDRELAASVPTRPQRRRRRVAEAEQSRTSSN